MNLKNKKFYLIGVTVVLAGLFFILSALPASAFAEATADKSVAGCGKNSGQPNLASLGSIFNPLIFFAEKTIKGFGYNIVLAQECVGAGTGTGLIAKYFDEWDGVVYDAQLITTRTETTVNFNPADFLGVNYANSPDGNTFSARWEGQVEALCSETYTFYTNSDDGVRLWVNGTLIIDNWTDHGPTENSGTIDLTAGQKYSIKMEFYENFGGAVAQLSWSSLSTPKTIIPQAQLYPDFCGSSSVGCSGSTPTATVSWEPAPSSILYDAEFAYFYTFCYYILTLGGNNYQIGANVPIGGDPSQTSYTVSSGLSNNTLYNWSVEAYYVDLGESDCGGVWDTPSASLGYGKALSNQPYGSFTTPDCVPNNPPSANNLSIDNFQNTVCGITGGAQVRFKWDFNDPGDTQSAYRLEVATDSGFSNIVVRSCDPALANPNATCSTAGTPGPSYMFVNQPSAGYALLSWGASYYWRLKVWDSNGIGSQWIYPPSPLGSPSPSPGTFFTTPAHSYPYPDFTPSPQNPAAGEVITFIDNSKCYSSPGNTEYSCSAGPSISYLWDFGNGQTSTKKGNATTIYSTIGPKTVRLTITDNSLTPSGICDTVRQVNVALSLPEWKEIPPF